MMESGVDFAVGTDNGMLCEPDLLNEIRSLGELMISQGCGSEDVLGRLSDFPSKLLYRTRRMEYKVNGGYLTVIPGKGDANCLWSTDGPIRIRFDSR
jgi:hypothetical protein